LNELNKKNRIPKQIMAYKHMGKISLERPLNTWH